MNPRRAIRWSLPVVLGLVSMLAGAAPAQAGRGCTDQADSVIPTQDKLGLAGLFSRPSDIPTTLVAFAHGYRKPATVYWSGHLEETAQHGALAVAMDYTGIGPAPDYRGWNVSAGAADTVTATKYFLANCPSIRQVILVGVSMGGNASGLALAAGEAKADGSPLFDYWIDVEGATNVIETYFEASAAAPVNSYAAGAQADIEAEMGGTFVQAPDRYLQETVVLRADDVAESGVRGVILIHALEDGLVPYDQSREMGTALRQRGVPTDFFTVLSRGSGESGTTLSGDILDPIYPSYQSPLAGHGAEESTTQLVIRTAFDRLWALIDGEAPGPSREFLVDGIAGTVPQP